MKVKYEIEADESGYTAKLTVDGTTIYQSVNEASASGSNKVSGDDDDDIPDPWHEIINDHCFIGLDFMIICQAVTEEY